MKRFLALLLALMMALSLVACGSAPAGDEGEGAADAEADKMDAPVEDTDVTEDPAPQMPSISFPDLENSPLLVADNENYSITVTGADAGSWWWHWSEETDYYKEELDDGYHVNLTTTNKSGETLYFLPRSAALNGVSVYCDIVDLADPELYWLELAQGETADWTICLENVYSHYWTGEKTQEFSISNDLVQNIQISVGAFTEEAFDDRFQADKGTAVFALYPDSYDTPSAFTRPSHSSDMVLFENEDVTVTAVTDVARNDLSAQGLELFVRDKGKNNYTEYMFDGNIINGIDTTGQWFDADGCGLFAKGCAFMLLHPHKAFDESSATILPLDEVESWEFTLRYTREGVEQTAKISLTSEDIEALYGEYFQTEPEPDVSDVDIPGFTAPDFTIPLVGGGEFTLSAQRGKVVLINFWATWCGPCCREMPAFTWLDEDYSDDEVAILCVNVWDDYAAMKDFIAENGYSFPIAYDTDEIVSSLYPTDGIPYTLIIGKDGYIVAEFVGAADAESQYREYKSAIDAALAS